LRKTRTELDGKLKTEKKAASQFKRRAKELEDRLTRSSSELERLKNQLARHGVSGKSGGVSGVESAEIEARVRDSIGALARATADLDKERRRLESTALQSRFNSVDAARLGKAFVNSFRSQLRLPAENLMQAIRGLLDLPLPENARRLVESAMESALVVQASVQEEAGGAGAADSSREAA